MQVTGIVCEFNPFHLGHAYLLSRLRQRGADAIVCAMSGNFVQRGEPALVNKLSRGEMAVSCGADLVLELPTAWAMATAETFARGGVQLLKMAGCTHIGFGSECGDTETLKAVAAALAFLPPGAAEVLLRELAAGRIADGALVERAILARLRQMTEEKFAAYDGGGEGLYHRVYDAVRRCATVEELLAAVKTKRYTAARLRRMVLSAWLGLSKAPETVPYARVLAANETGRALLRQMRKAGAPVLTKAADVAALGSGAEALFRREAGYTDLYTCLLYTSDAADE